MSSGYLEMLPMSSVTLANQTHTGGTYATSASAVPLVVRTSAPALELPAGMLLWQLQDKALKPMSLGMPQDKI